MPKYAEVVKYVQDKEKFDFGSLVTACTKIGIARSLITDANGRLHNDKLRQAIKLITEALDEEEKY